MSTAPSSPSNTSASSATDGPAVTAGVRRPAAAPVARASSGARAVLAVLLALAVQAEAARAAVVEEIVAKINNRIITRSTLDERTEAMMRQISQQYPSGEDREKEIQDAKDELLANLITESLLLERAETIFDIDKIRANLIEDFRKQQNINTDQELETALKEQQMTRRELEDHLMRLAVPNEIINYDVKRKISVSETEMKDYYNKHIARFTTQATVTLREVVLLYGASNREEVSSRAADVAGEAKAGADFPELVQRYSEAGTRESAGILGPFPAGDLLPAIAAAVSQLTPGQTTDPIDTGRSFHVVRLEARTEQVVKPLPDVKDEVYASVREAKFRPRFEHYLKRLWKENYIEIAPKYEPMLVVSPLKPRPGSQPTPGA